VEAVDPRGRLRHLGAGDADVRCRARCQTGLEFQRQLPLAGMLFCAPIIGLWCWCTDQYIVQRALRTPNQTVARQGSIFAAFLKLFPVFLLIIPGLICFALAKSGKVAELTQLIGRTDSGATLL